MPADFERLTLLDPLLASRVDVVQPDGDWRCSLSTTINGYAQVGRGGRHWLAHRYVYELLVGPIGVDADGVSLQLDHDCHNEAARRGECFEGECPHRRCVSPDHLTPRTASDHGKDSPVAVELAVKQSAKTHCPAGHLYDEANTIAHDGGRYCRTCRRACKRENYAAMREARQRTGLTHREYIARYDQSRATAERLIAEHNAHTEGVTDASTS